MVCPFQNKISYHAGHNKGAVGFFFYFVNIISKCLASNYFCKFNHSKISYYVYGTPVLVGLVAGQRAGSHPKYK